jgi:hypothetical protein
MVQAVQSTRDARNAKEFLFLFWHLDPEGGPLARLAQAREGILVQMRACVGVVLKWG